MWESIHYVVNTTTHLGSRDVCSVITQHLSVVHEGFHGPLTLTSSVKLVMELHLGQVLARNS